MTAAGMLAVAAVAALFAVRPSRGADEPATAIRAALEQWRTDFNSGRDGGICDLFAKDLRYDFQGLPEQSYQLLCDRLHRAVANPKVTFHYDLDIKEIIVSGDLAIVRLTWHSRVTEGGKTEAEEQPGLDVFGRQPDGTWKIIRYIAYPAHA